MYYFFWVLALASTCTISSSTSCSVCEQNLCLGCDIGYYLDQSVCTQCPNALNCRTCTTSTACSSCKNGFYLNSVNCVACSSIQNCIFCTGSGTCTLCIQGYWPNGSGVCTICSTGCLQCLSNTCYLCESGYYLSAGSCSSCSNGCTLCAAAYCYSCAAGYYGSGSTCTPCSAVCLTCSNVASVCETCAANYVKAQNTCIAACAVGQFVAGNACSACNSNCVTCNQSSTTCTSCAGKHLSSGICSCDNVCQTCFGSTSTCTSCAVGKYLSLGTCTNCPNQCSICTDSSTCVNCMKGYYASGGTCSNCNLGCAVCYSSGSNCTLCNDNFYYSSGTCAACSANGCQLCTSSANCLRCSLGYFLSGATCTLCSGCANGCITSASNCLTPPVAGCDNTCVTCDSSECKVCTAGSYRVAGSQVCTQCASPCKSCSAAGSSNCESCEPNYYLSSGSCLLCSVANCNTCADSSNCAYCSTGYTLVSAGYGTCTACTAPCLTCSESATNCTSCDQSHYYSANSCTACSITGCSKCVSVAVCVECAIGYSQSAAGACTLCATGCAACGSACVRCSLGYVMINSVCYLQTCTAAQYIQPSSPGCVASTGANCCSPCSSLNCLSCDNSMCFSCVVGYRLSGSACVQCSPYCVMCSVNACLLCQSRYYPVGPLCITCSTNNCAVCDSGDNCLKCAVSYYLNGINCQACPSACSQACVSSAYCLQCQIFYFLSAAGICTSCDSNCGHCAGTATTCLSCRNDFFLRGGVCYECTQSQYYAISSQSCINCDPSCRTCNDGLTCTTCVTNKFFPLGTVLAGTALCGVCPDRAVGQGFLCVCISGNYLSSSNTCIACPATCATCTVSTTCTSCIPNYYFPLTASALCVSACGQNQVLLSRTCVCNSASFLVIGGSASCVSCDSSCGTCSSLQTCLTCRPGFFFHSSNSLCVASCALNEDVNPANNKCTLNFCHQTCKTCLSPSSCTSCEEGLGFVTGGGSGLSLCARCSTSEYKSQRGVCQPCDKSCQTCANGFTCATCVQGTQYLLASGNSICVQPSLVTKTIVAATVSSQIADNIFSTLVKMRLSTQLAPEVLLQIMVLMVTPEESSRAVVGTILSINDSPSPDTKVAVFSLPAGSRRNLAVSTFSAQFRTDPSKVPPGVTVWVDPTLQTITRASSIEELINLRQRAVQIGNNMHYILFALSLLLALVGNLRSVRIFTSVYLVLQYVLIDITFTQDLIYYALSFAPLFGYYSPAAMPLNRSQQYPSAAEKHFSLVTSGDISQSGGVAFLTFGCCLFALVILEIARRLSPSFKKVFGLNLLLLTAQNLEPTAELKTINVEEADYNAVSDQNIEEVSVPVKNRLRFIGIKLSNFLLNTVSYGYLTSRQIVVFSSVVTLYYGSTQASFIISICALSVAGLTCLYAIYARYDLLGQASPLSELIPAIEPSPEPLSLKEENEGAAQVDQRKKCGSLGKGMSLIMPLIQLGQEVNLALIFAIVTNNKLFTTLVVPLVIADILNTIHLFSRSIFAGLPFFLCIFARYSFLVLLINKRSLSGVSIALGTACLAEFAFVILDLFLRQYYDKQLGLSSETVVRTEVRRGTLRRATKRQTMMRRDRSSTLINPENKLRKKTVRVQ